MGWAAAAEIIIAAYGAYQMKVAADKAGDIEAPTPPAPPAPAPTDTPVLGVDDSLNPNAKRKKRKTGIQSLQINPQVNNTNSQPSSGLGIPPSQ